MHLTRAANERVRGRAEPFQDEQGSMVVAVLVIMIVTLLGMTVSAQAITELLAVRQNQDFSASLAQADAGLADALFRIDQFGANDITSFCVGNSPHCDPTTVMGAPEASYSAVRVDSNTYVVTAMGDVNNRPHAIRATVTRSGLYPFALFGTGDVTFNGNGSGTIAATLPPVGDPPYYPPDPSRLADVGSNATITCNSGASEGNQQVSFKDSWKSCPTQIAGVGSYQPMDPVLAANCPRPNTNMPPVPCVPADNVLPCPSGNVFGTLGVIFPGAYLCTGTVSFTTAGPIHVLGAVEIYVIPTSGTANIELAGATINNGGDPTDFSLYLAGAGTVDTGNGAHAATMTGTIWAPSGVITDNGCQMSLTGSIVIGTYTCNGGPNLTINYDARLQALVSQNWTVSNYTEIPSSQFALPGF
jgi:hypothetical protein